MSMRPGMPERDTFADKLNQINSKIRALETAVSLGSSSIGSGGLKVQDGGKIQFVGSNGQVLATLDEDGHSTLPERSSMSTRTTLAITPCLASSSTRVAATRWAQM